MARAALASIDPDAPWYRFGDICFVRLDAPQNSPKLVFCWSYDAATDLLAVVADDGSTRYATAADWGELWQDDALAREALGLPEFVPPPLPN